MKDSERLMRALIHRHLTANEIGADRGNPDAQYPFYAHLHLSVHLDQAQRRLADVLVQKAAAMQTKTAQAYHRAV